MAQNYTYSISGDTANGAADPGATYDEIIKSDITIALDTVTTSGDDLNINFKANIGTLDETTLDNLVSNHEGVGVSEPDLVSFGSYDANNIPLIVVDKAAGDFDTVVSHNFADKNSWEVSTTDSTWKLVPPVGEVYSLVKAEVQFDHDLDLSTTDILVDYYIWHPLVPGVPQLGKRVTFATIRSIFELGNAHYHCPALPEIPNGLSTVVFDYAQKLRIVGTETPMELSHIEISLDGHTEPTGTYATIGFVVEKGTI